MIYDPLFIIFLILEEVKADSWISSGTGGVAELPLPPRMQQARVPGQTPGKSLSLPGPLPSTSCDEAVLGSLLV